MTDSESGWESDSDSDSDYGYSSGTTSDDSESEEDSDDENSSDFESVVEIEPIIENTSQTLLHKWMNKLVALYNAFIEVEDVPLDSLSQHEYIIDPVALRQAADNIVKVVLEESQKKVLLGTLPLYDLVITILTRLWTRLHPFSLESEIQRLFGHPGRVNQPPFANFKWIQGLIYAGLRPLDALHSNVAYSLEPQFKLRRFEHRDCPTAVPAAPYHAIDKEYREKLARLKRGASSSDDSESEASNAKRRKE